MMQIKYILFALIVSQFFSGKINGQAFNKNNWTYIPVDSTKQKWGDWDKPEWLRYFGLDFGDVNRDGNVDIISGRYIYQNPGGDMNDHWKRFSLDDNVDAIFFIEADNDPFADIIAQALPDIYWYEVLDQEGTKYERTKIASIPATDHVNSQGFEKAQILPDEPEELIIAGKGGIYCITIPSGEEKLKDEWPAFLIAENTSGEGIGTGDIDGDGDNDIVCGRIPDGGKEPTILVWFENPGTIQQKWKDHEIAKIDHPIDRIEIADLNGDNQNEIVITEERWPGKEPDAFLYWFSQENSNSTEWKKHPVVQQYSMNNLDVADIDKDGDMDILTCEHKGPNLELQIWKNDGKANFTKHTIDTGKENHLGAQFVDLDTDGDLDIAGCGWDNYKWQHVWRNNQISPLGYYKIYREYKWLPENHTNGEPFLRVGGRLDYLSNAKHFPPEKLNNGFIRMVDHLDLKNAVHAELTLEKLQSHEDTKNLKVQINGNNWIPVHDPLTIRDTASAYMYHFYPKVNIPLNDLKEGYVDIKLKVDSNQKWDWPQNLIYGLELKIFYKAIKKEDQSIRITGIKDNGKLKDQQVLQIEAPDLSNVTKVDYIGFYEDINWPGDGKYLQWQYHYHKTQIKNHIGSSTIAPFKVQWNTRWIPDQQTSMKIISRIHTKSGLIYYSAPVKGVKLNRDYKISLIKPYQVPENWVTRAGEFTEYFHLSVIPQNIEKVKIHWRGWSPCYLEGLRLNNHFIPKNDEWPCYQYYEHTLELDDNSVLKKGQNSITTLKTSLHDGKMVHGMEVQWPGIMLKIKHQKKSGQLDSAIVMYQDRSHFRIQSNNITYYYDIQGGGFSRIIDSYGNDWISFKKNPWDQYPESAASSYRGLPNLVYKSEDGGAGHPGHDKCRSWIEENKIITESKSGKWKWSWKFNDNCAILDILKTNPDHNYWFLYEGTPGGCFKPNQFYFGTDKNGPLKETPDYFKHDIYPGTFRVIYSGVDNLDVVFFMLQKQADQQNDFISYIGNSEKGINSHNGMTNFAFGRDKHTKPLLSKPQKFVIGFYPRKITNSEDHQQFIDYINTNF